MDEPHIVTPEEMRLWELLPSAPPKRKARILLDENMPREISECLQKKGADVLHVGDLAQLHGRTDEEIAEHAWQNDLILLTTNAEHFGNKKRFPIERMPFTVILHGSSVKSILRSLNKVLWFVISFPRYDENPKRIRITVRGNGVLHEDYVDGQRIYELIPWALWPRPENREICKE